MALRAPLCTGTTRWNATNVSAIPAFIFLSIVCAMLQSWTFPPAASLCAQRSQFETKPHSTSPAIYSLNILIHSCHLAEPILPRISSEKANRRRCDGPSFASGWSAAVSFKPLSSRLKRKPVTIVASLGGPAGGSPARSGRVTTKGSSSGSKGWGGEIWLRRAAMLVFVSDLAVEIATGRGLLQVRLGRVVDGSLLTRSGARATSLAVSYDASRTPGH